ncbi:PREDICTED: uncharacterized protein LOC106314527 [Brassica oleracea var. oleracea]|uniref:uncharacterized protein LOC106314527 n=1 Tax=Brassica oleracea var. oleracea TaxID=109376 RepID=UPI0006A7078C|nr:PREDICTED: uncharacterized protein LOC106314527 [Brassica oleracea var. oleracea]
MYFMQWVCAASLYDGSISASPQPPSLWPLMRNLQGFFTSVWGIRQGSLLSPYIYVIVNNALSNMLNQAAADGKFGFHPKYEKVGLSHLSFANILVFTDETEESLNGVLTVMDHFAGMSGLQINASKSSIFCCWSEQPLAYSCCECERSKGRYLAYTLSRALSFAGRLQLIKTVITSTVNFWSSAFLLPKGCLDTIESMCSAFLWSGSPIVTHKAKVAWEDVCYPKEDGGLGLRWLRDTSRVFALRLIWLLFTQTGSFWVAWTKEYLLKHGSYWDEREGSLGSWVWRKLLKLQSFAFDFFRYEINNGRSTFFWLDNWLGTGRILDETGEIGIGYLGVPRSATISDVVCESGWKICSRGHRRFSKSLQN